MKKIYHHIVFLTGAGFSAESGLATFRGNGGLWNGCKVEDVATKEALADNRNKMFDFYNRLRREAAAAEPNAAHLALAELQKKYPGEVSIITQNLDMLHEKAKSQNVVHIHGQINQFRCLNCNNVQTVQGDVFPDMPCPCCGVRGYIRPNIVLFGEPLFFQQQAALLLKSADLFVAAGTSGEIYPAAGFAGEAKENGALTVALNLTIPKNHLYFRAVVLGKVGDNVPKFTEKLLALADIARRRR